MSRRTAKRGPAERVDDGRPAPKFIGFAEDNTDLYEFHTIGGEYVYVHETECIGIDFRPLTRQLVLTLECIESTLMDQLTLVMTFEGAAIYQWEQENVPDIEPTSRVRGQVRDLSMIARASFSMALYEMAMSFHATSVTCAVIPRVSGPA